MAQVIDESEVTNPSTEPFNAPVNSITFTLLCLPPSVNSLYQVIWSQRRIELKPECRLWKSDAKQDMPYWKPQSPVSFICIQAIFYYDFYYKNGNLREFDTANLQKLLIDAIAEKYGFKDSRVKRCPTDSLPARKERTVVTVSEYFLNECIEHNRGELTIPKGR